MGSYLSSSSSYAYNKLPTASELESGQATTDQARTLRYCNRLVQYIRYDFGLRNGLLKIPLDDSYDVALFQSELAKQGLDVIIDENAVAYIKY